MFNVITGREFEHTFEELMNHRDSIGRLGSTCDEKDQTVQMYSQVWNYYREAKNAEEVKAFDRAIPDGRTKIGKYAREVRIACGLDINRLYGRIYRRMCCWDYKLNAKDEVNN